MEAHLLLQDYNLQVYGKRVLLIILSRDGTKPVFRVSYKASFKLISLSTDTSYKIEISPVACLHMVLSKKRITKALIRLRGCTGLSAPDTVCCSQIPEDRVSRNKAHSIVAMGQTI